jgi:hypothetical protein
MDMFSLKMIDSTYYSKRQKRRRGSRERDGISNNHACNHFRFPDHGARAARHAPPTTIAPLHVTHVSAMGWMAYLADISQTPLVPASLRSFVTSTA